MVISQRVITNISLMLGTGRNGRKVSAGKVLTNTQMLSRLATDPRDAAALIAVYEHYEREIRAVAISWFGKDPEVRNKAVNSILVAIARQAGNYDPQSMDAAEWVRQCANAEAKKLREALDARLSIGPQSAIRARGGHSRSFGEEAGQDRLDQVVGIARHKRRCRGSAK